MGKTHFQILFREVDENLIMEMLQVVQLFHRYVNEEDQDSLLDEVSLDELKEVLSTFQKDKSLGLDGWVVEAFMALFEMIGVDII